MTSYLADKKTLDKDSSGIRSSGPPRYIYIPVDESLRQARDDVQGDFLVSGNGIGFNRKGELKATPAANRTK